MSASSPILICPVVQLHSLPDAERDILRRFFTEHVRGMDAVNDRRWRGLVRDLFNAEPGEGFELLRKKERGGPFHRRHRVILQRLFDSQERYSSIEALHDHLKLKTWFVEWHDGKPKPRSTSFDRCSEAEMQQFHTDMVDLLHSPYEQRHLFPQVRPRDRHAMVEAVLRSPNEEVQ